MKKWIRYVILSAGAVAVCFLYAHIDKVHNVYDITTDNSSYVSANIMGDSFVSQSFRCTEDCIDGISLQLLLSGEAKEGELQYRLLDESGQELHHGVYPIEQIKSERINKIMFDKTVESTRDNVYKISLKAEGLGEGASLGIYYDPVGKKTGDLEVNGKKTEGTLVLRWITHRFDAETFIVTLGIIVYFVAFFKILYRLFS